MKITTLLLCVIAGGMTVAGCAEPAAPDNLVQFATIASGEIGSVRLHDRNAFQVYDRAEMVKLWNEAYALQDPKPQMPEIDFAATSVIAVSIGERPNGCYRMNIESMADEGDEVIVTVREHQPGLGCECTSTVVSPFQIITTKKLKDLLQFKWRTSRDECS